MRRVVSAREQVELLSPWKHRAAAPSLIVPRRLSGPLVIPSPSLDKHGWSQDRLNANALSHWDNADELTRHEAGFWYPVAHQWSDHITGHLGMHPHKGYGIIAASSPLRRWDGNLQDAHNFFTHYPHSPENVRKPPGPAGGQNLARMQQVFHAADDPAAIRAALSSNKAGTIAPKISNFHDNMEDPHAPDPVTIDSWMPRGILWGHDEEPWIPDELNIPNAKGNLPTPRDIGLKALGWTGGYDRMAEAIRHVARERGLEIANIPQAGIWSKLGGTPSPDDSMPDHPDGPLSYINDPSALYHYTWAQHSRQHPSGLYVPGSLRTAAPHYVDHHWDHLVSDMTPEEIAFHHTGRPTDSAEW